jgi:hypothetical protein
MPSLINLLGVSVQQGLYVSKGELDAVNEGEGILELEGMNYCGIIVDHQVKVVDAGVVDIKNALEESVALLLLDVKDTDPSPVPDNGETHLALFIQSKDLDRLDVSVVGWVLERQIDDFLLFSVNNVYLG